MALVGAKAKAWHRKMPRLPATPARGEGVPGALYEALGQEDSDVELEGDHARPVLQSDQGGDTSSSTVRTFMAVGMLRRRLCLCESKPGTQVLGTAASVPSHVQRDVEKSLSEAVPASVCRLSRNARYPVQPVRLSRNGSKG